MKRLVTLIAVAALLGTVAVCGAQTTPAQPVSDTLVLKAAVAQYASVLFENGGDPYDDIITTEGEKALEFDFDSAAVQAAYGDTAQSQSRLTMLKARANYSVGLELLAQAPKEAARSNVLKTQMNFNNIYFTDGNQAGENWDFIAPTGPVDPIVNLYSTNGGVINLVDLIGNPWGTHAVELSPYTDSGIDIQFTVTVWPEMYVQTAGVYSEAVVPAMAGDYNGYFKATLIPR